MQTSTEQENIISALQRSEKKYRLLIERSYILVIIIDEHQRIKFAFDSLDYILGISSQDSLGCVLREVLPFQEHELLQAKFSYLAESMPYTSIQLELSLQHKVGGTFVLTVPLLIF